MDINKVGLRETLEALRVELSKSILASIKIPLKPIGKDGGPIKTASDDIPD